MTDKKELYAANRKKYIKMQKPYLLPCVCKRGDVWRLGRHRLICADSSDFRTVDVLFNLQDEPAQTVVNLIVTDPPYGVSYNRLKYSAAARASDEAKKKQQKIVADDLSGVVLQSLLSQTFRNVSDYSRNATAYVFFPALHSTPFQVALQLAGFKPAHMLHWFKGKYLPISRAGGFAQACEMIMYARQGSKNDVTWNGGFYYPSVFECDPCNPTSDSFHVNVWHQTEKPVDLLKRFIELSSNIGDVVYDPFTGGASTMIAAEQTGRRFFGCEIAPMYCSSAVRRWVDFTDENEATCQRGDERLTYRQCLEIAEAEAEKTSPPTPALENEEEVSENEETDL